MELGFTGFGRFFSLLGSRYERQCFNISALNKYKTKQTRFIASIEVVIVCMNIIRNKQQVRSRELSAMSHWTSLVPMHFKIC